MGWRVVEVKEPLSRHELRSLLLQRLVEGGQDVNGVLGVDLGPNGGIVLVQDAAVVEEAEHHLFLPCGRFLSPCRGWGPNRKPLL